MRQAILFTGVLLGLLALPPGQMPGQQPGSEATEAAIQRGITYLKRSQQPGGYWVFSVGPGGAVPGPGHVPTQDDVGVTALCALTLLECGVPASDPAVVRATGYLRRAAGDATNTYAISLIIMFLDRLGESKDTEIIRGMALRLAAGQGQRGGWGYECPILNVAQQRALLTRLGAPPPQEKPDPKSKQPRRPPAGGTIGGPEGPPAQPPGAPGNPLNPGFGGFTDGDNSNTQFAILALWIARRHTVPVEPLLRRTEARFRSTQAQDGGWGYTAPLGVGQTLSRPSMTCAGLLGIALGFGVAKESTLRARSLESKDERDDGGQVADIRQDRQVQAALRYLATAYRGGAPEALENGCSLYFFWSLERVGVAYGIREVGGVDWFAVGTQEILKVQHPDGHWATNYPGLADTCFAMLFLRRSNLVPDLSSQIQGQATLRAGDLGSKAPTKSTAAKPGTAKPAAPLDPLEIEARKVADELRYAPPSKQDALLNKLQETRGAAYTQALADIVPRLQGEIKDRARDALVERLGRMTARTLKDYLADENRELRLAAARAAPRKDDRTLCEPLIGMLGDSDEALAATAYESLKRMTGQDFGKSENRWKAWLDKQK